MSTLKPMADFVLKLGLKWLIALFFILFLSKVWFHGLMALVWTAFAVVQQVISDALDQILWHINMLLGTVAANSM